MPDYNSLPTVDQVNLDTYWEIVRKLEPEFYMLRIALAETGVNPMILPKVVRAISNLATGSGYGKVQIYVQDRIVTTIDGEEKTIVKLQAIIDK